MSSTNSGHRDDADEEQVIGGVTTADKEAVGFSCTLLHHRNRATTADTHIKSDDDGDDENDEDVESPSAHQLQETTRTTATATSTSASQRSNSTGSTFYIDDEEILKTLQPPMGKIERLRDWFLRKLDTTFFQGLGIVVLVLVIADGALFFFLLMGWHMLCDDPSKTDCEPRNWWYNWSIQVLNVLFTYMAVVSWPWRCANFLHLTGTACPRRSNDIGYNLYGLPDPELWFHIPVVRRLGITVVLLLNCIFQFINQGTRIGYYRYESQDTAPGNIWTNVFFAASFACAAAGGVWMLAEAARLRKLHPGKFGLGPMEAAKLYYHTHIAKDRPPEEEEAVAAPPYMDPTRNPNHSVLIGDESDRASMRMWAM